MASNRDPEKGVVPVDDNDHHSETLHRPTSSSASEISSHDEDHPTPIIAPAGDFPVPPKESELQRAQSRASSARSRALTIVPRSKRRGLFGRFALLPEVENPYEYKNSTKWSITIIIAIATAAAPLGSAIFYRKVLCNRESQPAANISQLLCLPSHANYTPQRQSPTCP